jgi:predicted nucleic acid-binding protein
MSVERFIDTNVFIYQIEAADKRKAAIANELIRDGIAGGRACISFQVVQETLNVVLRKAEIPLGLDAARHYLDTVLAPLWRVMPSLSLYQRALDVQGRYRYGFYDALIIAGALEGGCTRLYSEDLQHGQRIEGLTIQNPFAGG